MGTWAASALFGIVFCDTVDAFRLQDLLPPRDVLGVNHFVDGRKDTLAHGAFVASAFRPFRSPFDRGISAGPSTARFANAFTNSFMVSDNYNGVEFDSKSGNWRAWTDVNGEQKLLGVFKSEIEAAVAHDSELRAQGLTARTLYRVNFRTRDDVKQASSAAREEILPSASTASFSIYNGIEFDTPSGTWKAHMVTGGIQQQLGSFDSELEAAIAYDEELRSRGLDFNTLRRLNFLLFCDVEQALSDAPAGLSMYHGVYFDRGRCRYLARAHVDGAQTFLGRFQTEMEAAIAYDESLRAAGLTIKSLRKLNFVTLDDISEASSADLEDEATSFPAVSSIYKGVSQTGGKWKAQTFVNGKTTNLGNFEHELEAALAHDKEIRAQGLNSQTVRALNFRTTDDTLEASSEAGEVVSSRSSLGSRSAYVGVYRANGRWRARASVKGKRKHLGYFDDEIEAALAYDEELRGQGLSAKLLRKLNFRTKEDVQRVSSGASTGESLCYGVSKQGDRWSATAFVNGCRKVLGSFESELEAAVAYDDELRAQGLDAIDLSTLNFPTKEDAQHATFGNRME